MNLKRYACLRLYDACGQCFPQAFVTIDSLTGLVVDYGLLKEELPATEWMGGVVVLSDREGWAPQVSFKSFVSSSQANRPLYAWHISTFDFTREELTSQSVIRRL